MVFTHMMFTKISHPSFLHMVSTHDSFILSYTQCLYMILTHGLTHCLYTWKLHRSYTCSYTWCLHMIVTHGLTHGLTHDSYTWSYTWCNCPDWDHRIVTHDKKGFDTWYLHKVVTKVMRQSSYTWSSHFTKWSLVPKTSRPFGLSIVIHHPFWSVHSYPSPLLRCGNSNGYTQSTFFCQFLSVCTPPGDSSWSNHRYKPPLLHPSTTTQLSDFWWCLIIFVKCSP